ncbi:hypothetical protein B0H34DRAFT_709336 [Crassisporium funariophilum]|nr:hypothetical protein B0H34DRAFT_709336 [Crassisporium funariophilum]
MPSTRYLSTPHRTPNSSDTEQLETPPRKRFREVDEDSSAYTPRSPRKRQCTESPKKQQKDFDLAHLLRNCLVEPTNHTAIMQLKDIPKDENISQYLVQRVINIAKTSVLDCFDTAKGKLLETELYLEWLNELDYVISAVDIALNAKMPGTRRRVSGLGRLSFTILFQLVDDFVSEVNNHHDTWYQSSLESCPLYPATMTLVEESKDPSTDVRSDAAVRLAEECLKNIDRVMSDAVRRYKVECGRNNPSLARRIAVLEHTLAKSCCLLCEQTGYGGDDDDIGDTLMQETKNVMSQWKREYEDCEDQLVDSDAGHNS